MNRLLVLTELFLPTKGGTAVWAAEVYKRLGGKEIHIVTADVPGDVPGDVPAAAEIDSVHPNSIHRIDLRRVRWLKPESLAMYARLFFKSLRLALTHRFDAIHAFPFLFRENGLRATIGLGDLAAEADKANPLTDADPPATYFDILPSFNSPFSQVAPELPCPCGSGLRFAECHGASA